MLKAHNMKKITNQLTISKLNMEHLELSDKCEDFLQYFKTQTLHVLNYKTESMEKHFKLKKNITTLY